MEQVLELVRAQLLLVLPRVLAVSVDAVESQIGTVDCLEHEITSWYF